MTSQQRDSVLQQRRQRWSQNHGNSGEHECEAGEHIADWIEQCNDRVQGSMSTTLFTAARGIHLTSRDIHELQ